MTGMLYKEIMTHTKQLRWVIPLLLIGTLFPLIPVFTTPDLENWELNLVLGWCDILTLLAAGMYEQGIFEADEKSIYRSFILSVPGGAYLQTGSKYLFNILFSGLRAVLMLIVILISGAIKGMDISINIDILMILLFIQLFFRTLETPFIVRFGTKNGNSYRMIFLEAILFAAIVYGLFGDLSVFGSMESFIKGFQEFFSKNNSLIYRLTPLMVLPFYFLSFLFSCRLFTSEKTNHINA